jgi:membrane protease YdiL (CAAX protease family)
MDLIMKKLFFIKRYPVQAYFLAVFTISWGLILLLAGAGNIPLDPEQSKSLLPLLYAMMLVGPGAAGVLLIGLVYGKEGFRNFKTRLFRWRVGIHWYLVALLGTPILSSLILLILSCLSPEFNIGIFYSEDKITSIMTGIITGIMVGFFEETGWSGFIVPKLRLRYSITITGLIVGSLWGAWHFILFWEGDSFSKTLPLFILLARLFAWLPPFRVLMVWILDRTGSLLIVILTHASLVFTTTVLVPMTLTGKNLLIWLIAWSLALWLIAGAITMLKIGTRPR